MSSIDVIKENVQFEQLVREGSSNIILKDEYLIPDTHPDVEEILCIQARPVITSKDIVGDKVALEGKVEYTVMYLAKEDEMIANSVDYTQKFTTNIDLKQGEHNIICEVELKIEHIEAMIMNERKIAIQGILSIEWEILKNKEFEFVKDIEGNSDVQVLKKAESIDKISANKETQIEGKSIMRVGMDKPQIGKILNSSALLHKKEIKIVDDKVYIGCYCRINILYKGDESKDIFCLEDDVYVSKEEEIEGITSEMMPSANFDIVENQISLEEDDLGEVRIINNEFIINVDIKIFSKEEIDTIKDAYSPKAMVDVKKEQYEVGMIQGSNMTETIVKDGIQLKENDLKPEQIISTNGTVILTDKEVKKDRVEVEGVIKIDILYKTTDDNKYLSDIKAEIPFTTAVDISGAQEGMKSIVKSALENIEAFLESNSISVKSTISLNTKVFYETQKEFISDIIEQEGEKPEKDASIIIYVVGDGDCLWELAKKYNTTIDELIKINSIEDPNYIEPGGKLIIPGRAKF